MRNGVIFSDNSEYTLQDYSQQPRLSSGNHNQVQELGLLSLFAFKAKELNEVRSLVRIYTPINKRTLVIRTILQRAVRFNCSL